VFRSLRAPETIWAAYAPAGGAFGAPETVASMGGSAEIGGVVRNDDGRATIALNGLMTSPTSTEGITTLTRSPDGTRGSPGIVYDTGGAAIVPQSETDYDSAALARDTDGDLYVVWDTRATQDDETSTAGIFGEVTASDGSFSGNPSAVQQAHGTLGALDTAPVVAAAGDTATAGWAIGVVRSSFAGQDSTYSPATAPTLTDNARLRATVEVTLPKLMHAQSGILARLKTSRLTPRLASLSPVLR
jgi:hypothetical protein